MSELLQKLNSAGIAYAKMNSVDGVIQHEQLSMRHRWQDVDTPAGTIEALRPVFGSGEAGPVPALGQNSRRILSELGYSAVQADQLITQGVVGE